MADPSPTPDPGAGIAARAERRWAVLSVAVIAVLVAVAAFAGIHRATMPQALVQKVDPSTLHVAGEFVESNLGTAVQPDGSVAVRLIAQQYSFTPQCIVVPAATPITFRATSADVVHGFLVEGTNVNTMLVPGYISAFSTSFAAPGEHAMPCHEFCGVGHAGMWAKVEVLPRAAFLKLAADRRRLSCVD